MKTTHTPNPWMAIKGKDDADIQIYGTLDGRTYPIGCVWEGAFDEGDARLIAAAPDLLGALAVAKAILDELNRHNGTEIDMTEIDAALAKATGKGKGA